MAILAAMKNPATPGKSVSVSKSLLDTSMASET